MADVIIRTKSGVPVEADFQNVVTPDGGFVPVPLVINSSTGRPYTRTAAGAIQPSALGAGTASGTNTGDQDLSPLVPKTTTVNSKPLSGNIVLTAADVGAPAGSGTATGTNTGDQDLSGYGLKAGKLTQFAATSSSELAGVLSDELGSGKAVFGEGSTAWTPSFTNLTVVNGTGGATYSGTWHRIGNIVFWTARIAVTGTCTTASTASSTYINNLPATPALYTTCNVANLQAITTGPNGTGMVHVSGYAFTTTWSAYNNDVLISGWFPA